MRKLKTYKHKAMIIPDHICKNDKNMFMTVNHRNECKMEFSDNLWLQFIDKPQPNVVIFSIIYSDLYKNIVTKWDHGISTHYYF